MKLYLLRHGKASDYGASGRDADRELTPQGIEELRKMCRRLSRHSLDPDVIITSPLARARQTAEIAADAWGLKDRLHVDSRLACGFGLVDLQAVVQENPRLDSLMLVGHNPDMSIVAGTLSGGAVIDVKKGGLLRLDVRRVEPAGAILEWVLTPSLLLD